MCEYGKRFLRSILQAKKEALSSVRQFLLRLPHHSEQPIAARGDTRKVNRGIKPHDVLFCGALVTRMDAISLAQTLVGDEVDIETGCVGKGDGGGLECAGKGRDKCKLGERTCVQKTGASGGRLEATALS